ncbi:hypothetical protein NHF48_002770 [Sphingomonas sp. H160509]|uniref:hypothetical protein n=1 Tax=Sphingomonas sp. H160509 TaxID=2955313 RepID=UPI002097ADA6|nr:hypothetical protein [Sphingomonas sp. H160509]MDD1450129.1 hypothetical protein [Sphingomonas sp. H160509]
MVAGIRHDMGNRPNEQRTELQPVVRSRQTPHDAAHLHGTLDRHSTLQPPDHDGKTRDVVERDQPLRAHRVVAHLHDHDVGDRLARIASLGRE